VLTPISGPVVCLAAGTCSPIQHVSTSQTACSGCADTPDVGEGGRNRRHHHLRRRVRRPGDLGDAHRRGQLTERSQVTWVCVTAGTVGRSAHDTRGSQPDRPAVLHGRLCPPRGTWRWWAAALRLPPTSAGNCA